MSPFFHFVGKTKILLPPPPLQIKGVATNASMEVNGPFSAPFLTYPLRSKQATQKKKVSNLKPSFHGPKSQGNEIPSPGDLAGWKCGRSSAAAACLPSVGSMSWAFSCPRGFTLALGAAAVQPPRFSTCTQPAFTMPSR